MPYTFAHIGFVIPFKQKWNQYFSMTGLVFGSIAPDFDILFRFTQNRFHIFDYNLSTIVLLIYPLAFISAFAFHFFCRTVVFRHLPEVFQKKYHSIQDINVKQFFKQHFLRMSFSILFAIFLHLLLDNLCHIFNAYYVKMFVLKYTENIHLAAGSYYAAIYLLPVLFTLAGFYLLYRNIISPEIKLTDFYLNKEKITFWFSIVLFTIIILVFKVILSTIEQEFLVDFFLISTTSSIIMAFYSVCLIYYFYLKIAAKKIA